MNTSQFHEYIKDNKIIIIVCLFFLMIIPLIYTPSCTYFSCQRLGKDNIICQRKQRILYGLINHSLVSFPLRGIEVKTKEKRRLLSDDCCRYRFNESIYLCSNSWTKEEKCDYSYAIVSYQLFLKAENSSFFLDMKASQGYLQSQRDIASWVKQQQEIIENFMKGSGEAFYEYKKIYSSSWFFLIVMFIISILVFV